MLQQKSKWGLVNEDFATVADFATILETSVSQDSRVVSSVIENGSFSAYNKTELPDEIGIRAILSGGSKEQEQTLQTLKDLKQSTDLLQLVTPFEVYSNLNLVTVKYERTVSLGTSTTIVDLKLQEIRQVEVKTERMSSAKQCKNAGSVSNSKTGRVSTEPLDPKLIEAIDRSYPEAIK